MEIRVLTSMSVHSRGFEDFIASHLICGKIEGGLQFRRTGGEFETVSAVLDDAGAIGHDYSEFSSRSKYHVEHDRDHRGDGEGLAEDR